MIAGVGGADTVTVTVTFEEVVLQGPLARYVNVSVPKYAAELDVYLIDAGLLRSNTPPWFGAVTCERLEIGIVVKLLLCDVLVTGMAVCVLYAALAVVVLVEIFIVGGETVTVTVLVEEVPPAPVATAVKVSEAQVVLVESVLI
ncbi:MAG: hypothetical protein ACXWIN_00815 [Burkholderiaceae bacterium]